MNEQSRHDESRSGHSGAEGTPGLARLDELDDFEIADGEPDIRGWKVKTADGAEIGTVRTLIADPAAMEIRFLEVEVKEKFRGRDGSDCVTVPLSAARLNDDDDTVLLQHLDAVRLRNAPRFARGPVTDDHRQAMVVVFGPTPADPVQDQARFFGKRREGRNREKYLRPIPRAD